MKEYSGFDFDTYSPSFVHPVQGEYTVDATELEQIDSYEARFVNITDKKKRREINKKEQLAVLRLKKNTLILGREHTDVTSPEQLTQYEEPKPPVEEEEQAENDEGEDGEENEEEEDDE